MRCFVEVNDGDADADCHIKRGQPTEHEPIRFTYSLLQCSRLRRLSLAAQGAAGAFWGVTHFENLTAGLAQLTDPQHISLTGCGIILLSARRKP